MGSSLLIIGSQPDWQVFRYELAEIESPLLEFVDRAGWGSGAVQALPESEQSNAIADLMIVEALKTSEIEGEVLSRPDVASSIRNGLGLNCPHQLVQDRAKDCASETAKTHVKDSVSRGS